MDWILRYIKTTVTLHWCQRVVRSKPWGKMVARPRPWDQRVVRSKSCKTNKALELNDC